MESKIHDLKIEPRFAQLYYDGKKHWEVRKNDRDFKEGDIIRFTIIGTKNTYCREICNVFSEFGLQADYVILSLSVIQDDVAILCKYQLHDEISIDTFLNSFKSNQIKISSETFIERFKEFDSKSKLNARQIIRLLKLNPNYFTEQKTCRDEEKITRVFEITKI